MLAHVQRVSLSAMTVHIADGELPRDFLVRAHRYYVDTDGRYRYLEPRTSHRPSGRADLAHNAWLMV